MKCTMHEKYLAESKIYAHKKDTSEEYRLARSEVAVVSIAALSSCFSGVPSSNGQSFDDNEHRQRLTRDVDGRLRCR